MTVDFSMLFLSLHVKKKKKKIKIYLCPLWTYFPLSPGEVYLFVVGDSRLVFHQKDFYTFVIITQVTRKIWIC